MKHKIIIIFVLALMFSLAGCGNTNKLAEYDMTGISFISYTDIDTVCEDEKSFYSLFLFLLSFLV